MDLQLDDNHDLEVVDYDLRLQTGLPLMQQRLRQSLWFFLGEWYLDVTDGVPYYEEILIKNPAQTTVESIFKATILETPGVLELESFDIEYTNADRNFSLAFRTKTEDGTLETNEVTL